MRIRPVIALSVAGLAAAIMVMPSSAGASPASSAATAHQDHSTEWRPGHKLPHIPKGDWLVAWPTTKVLKTLTPGETVPTVHIKTGLSRRQEIKRYKHLENTNGLVNVELERAGHSSGSNSPKAAPCRPSPWQFLGPVGQKAATVAQSYSTIPNVTQKFTYGHGQSTTIAAGLGISTGSGSFGESGTTEVDSYGTWKFTPQYGRSFNHWRTYFEWGLYEQHTTGLCGGVKVYQLEPYQWNGGSAWIHPTGAPNAPNCVPAHRLDAFTGGNTTASTIKFGFEVLGLKGSVQTGYDTNAQIEIDYHLAKGQKAQACGTTGAPESGDPGVLVASK